MLEVEPGTSFAWTIIGHQQAGNTYTIVDGVKKNFHLKITYFKMISNICIALFPSQSFMAL